MYVVLDGLYKYTANYNTTEWNLSKKQMFCIVTVVRVHVLYCDSGIRASFVL
jgi:hypothetical protein